MKKVIWFLMFAFLCLPLTGWTAEQSGDMNARLAKVEKVLDMFHLEGDLTTIVQGSTGYAPGDKVDANISMDLELTADFKKCGQFFVHFDFGQGDGLNDILGWGDNGLMAGTGPNADLEYENDNVHVVEAYYQNTLGPLTFTIGKYDPVAFFDTNNLANDETSQFLADMFVNNPTIQFGGDENWFGPGAVFSLELPQNLSFNVGILATKASSGDGGWNNILDNPFVIGELDFNPDFGFFKDHPGHYGIYVWANTFRNNFSDFETSLPRTAWGIGFSFDQALTEYLSAFLRFGYADKRCVEVNYHTSFGLQFNGNLWNRTDDVFSLAYGIDFISPTARKADPSSYAHAQEHYIETYYSFVLNDHISISPDVQFGINPAKVNNGNKDSFYTLLAVRFQVNF